MKSLVSYLVLMFVLPVVCFTLAGAYMAFLNVLSLLTPSQCIWLVIALLLSIVLIKQRYTFT